MIANSFLTRFSLNLFTIVFCYTAVSAQPKTPPVPIPPPPTAATLGKFGEIPVSLYTGTPSIEIPLYTIKTKQHTIPISLSYHASGVHVEEEASPVGLGWALNAGGVITRSVRDGDDLQEYGSSIKYGYATVGHAALPTWTTDGTNNYNPKGKSQAQLDSDLQYYCDNTQDTQPDIFYYNFQGYSGKFYIERPSAQSAILVHVQSQTDNLLVEPTTINGQNAWQITTDNGYKYVFGERETTRARTEANTNTNTNPNLQFSVPSDFTYTSSWYLSAITAPDGEVVTFNYDRLSSYKTYGVYSGNSRESLDRYGSCKYIAFSPTYFWFTVSSSCQYVTTAPIIRSIEYQTGSITFNSLSRDDIAGAAGQAAPAKRITGFLVYGGTGPITRFIKGVDFIQSYFGNANLTNGGAPATSYLRLRLDGIQETGARVDASPAYSFGYNYNANNTLTSLPRKDSYAKDHYGYFNGAIDNDARGVLFPHLSVSITHPDNTVSDFSSEPVYDADREYHGQYATVGCLTSIRYPTRGTTTFEFESNDYADGATTLPGPGIRVKTITSRSDAGAEEQVKRFLYTDYTGVSSGKLMSKLNYSDVEVHQIYGTNCSQPVYNWVLNRFAASTTPMGTAAQGRPLGYSIVTQLDGIKDANGTLNFRNGKVEYAYDNFPEIPAGAPYIPGTPNNIPSGNGLLTRQTTYKCTAIATSSQGPRYQKLDETFYQYFTTDFFTLKGAVLRPHSCPGEKDEFLSDQTGASMGYTLYPLQEIVKYYDNNYYWQRKASVTKVVYDQYNEAKSTNTVTAYTYDNVLHKQPTLVTKTLSDGQIIKEYTAYPSDYSGAGVALTAMAGSLRILAQPVETISTLTKPSGTENIVSATFNRFALTGPSSRVAVPIQIDQLELTAPISFNSFQRSSPGATPDARYQPQQTSTYEAATGNMTGLQKSNDVLTSYQWGYAGQLPVAVYRNADRTPPYPANLSYGNEASSIGFESDAAVNNAPAEDYWGNLNVAPSNGSFSSDSHTGSLSWRMGPASGGPNYGPTRVFQPARQQIQYRLSCWVKTGAGFGTGAGKLVLSINDGNNNPVNCSDCYKSASFDDTQGQWRYVEIMIDLGVVHTQTNIATSTPLRIVAYTYNTSGQAYLVDDIRFQPVAAATTTFTYDAANRQPTSISDARSYPTYYEYDNFQRLQVVKDHRAGIQKHFEYHYQQQ